MLAPKIWDLSNICCSMYQTVISLYMFLYSKSSCSSYCINKNFACYKPKAPRTALPSHMCILFFNTPNVCITTYSLASPRHDNCEKKLCCTSGRPPASPMGSLTGFLPPSWAAAKGEASVPPERFLIAG